MIPHELIRSNAQGLAFLGPEIVLTAALLVVFCLGLILPYRRRRGPYTLLGLAGLAGALAAVWSLPPATPASLQASGLFLWDEVAVFFKFFLVAVAAVTIILCHLSDEIEASGYSEAVVLVLSVTVGMMLLTAAADLLLLYLAFETMGVLSYLLVGLKARNIKASEAALKYVLYGAVTSGVMLYGFSLLYGLAGTTSLTGIARAVAQASLEPQNRLLLVLATVCVLAGLLFKTASFPFHFWCPDVYEGAPTPITAFLSVGPKSAGFALFIRLFYPLFAAGAGQETFKALSGLEWPTILALLSAATMTLGNLAAMRQNNLKRLLAYSSIAHAGYLLMGLAALSGRGLKSVLFYLVVYLFMNLGAFAVVAMVARDGGSEEIGAYRGLGSRAPFACVLMSVFLFSLIGLPPFAGFVGKIYLFSAIIDRSMYWLAVVAALNTVVSLYYYLRIVKAMFLEPAEGAFEPKLSLGSQTLLTVLAVPTLGLGVYWQPLAGAVARLF